MNIVYRVVWNRAKGEWTAVSELAKSRSGKAGESGAERHVVGRLTWAIACVLGGAVMGTPMAFAGTSAGQTQEQLQAVSPRLADLSDLLVKYGNAQPQVVRQVAPRTVATAQSELVPTSAQAHVAMYSRQPAAREVASVRPQRSSRVASKVATRVAPASVEVRQSSVPAQQLHSPQLATNAQIAAVLSSHARTASATANQEAASTAGTWVVGSNGALHVTGSATPSAQVAMAADRSKSPVVTQPTTRIAVTQPHDELARHIQQAAQFAAAAQQATLASVQPAAPNIASLGPAELASAVALPASQVQVTAPQAETVRSLPSTQSVTPQHVAAAPVVATASDLPPVVLAREAVATPLTRSSLQTVSAASIAQDASAATASIDTLAQPQVPQPDPQPAPQPVQDNKQLAAAVPAVASHTALPSQTSGQLFDQSVVDDEPLVASVASTPDMMATNRTGSVDTPAAATQAMTATNVPDTATTAATTPTARDAALATDDPSDTSTGTSTGFAAAAFGTAQAVAPVMAQPMALATGDPRNPPPPETPTPGLIIGTGGLVGNVGGTLNPVTGALLDPSDPYLESGALKLAKANITTAYSGGVQLNVLGLKVTVPVSVVNTLSAVGGATVGTGENQHLTLLGGVTSDSYITNINNGATNGGIINSSDPAWSSSCLNVNIAGLAGVDVPCWGVNAAQNNQVLIGDGAYANGSEEVVIGTGASHKLADVNANTAFPGDGNRNSATDPMGLPDDNYQSRLGHSVVIGDSATGTQTAQTILGANATSDQANSVALGYGSNADRGAVASYTDAPGLIGSAQTSAGEVAVGNTGHNRQITHVAAGEDDYDAVNVLQLKGAIAGADTGNVQYDKTALPGGGSVIDYGSVTLAGTPSTDGGVTNGTRITNLHQGVVGTTSTDAVNGSQLSATNQEISNVIGGSIYDPTTNTWTAPQLVIHNITTGGDSSTATYDNVTDAFNHLDTSVNNVNTRVTNIYNTGTKYFHTKSTLGDSSPTGTNSIAVGPLATASQTDAIAIGDGANASMANSIALGAGSATTVGALTNYTAYALKAKQTSVGEVNVGNRQVTGVAAGSADDDAVNVAQLKAVSGNVDNLSDRAVKYDLNADGTVNYNSATLAGSLSSDGGVTGGTTVTNLHQGALTATSTDAVNGAQLYAINNTVASYFGGVTSFNGTTWVPPDFSILQVDSAGNTTTGHYSDVTSAFNALDASLQNIINNNANNSKYFKANSTGAAADASGTESVAMGGDAKATGDNSVAAGSGASASEDGSVAVGQGASSTVAGGVALGQGSVADRTGSGTEAFTKTAVPAEGVVSVGSPGHERQITNVAGGTDPTDAVNVRQLTAVATMINDVSDRAVMYDDTSKQKVTLDPGGQSALLTNVAAGSVSTTSTDAINGSQLFNWTQNLNNKYSNYSLYNLIQNGGNNSNPSSGGTSPFFAVNNTKNLPAAKASGDNTVAAGAGAVASGDNSTALGNGATAQGAGSVALGAGSEATRTNVVSVGSAGNARQITNVAAGTEDTDAVNVQQLDATSAGDRNWAKDYTDSQVSMFDRQLNEVGKNAYAGIASAMALAELPSAYEPGKNMVSLAAGTFHGQSGLAVGVSLISDNGRWVFKLGGSASSQGDAGGAVGVGIQW